MGILKRERTELLSGIKVTAILEKAAASIIFPSALIFARSRLMRKIFLMPSHASTKTMLLRLSSKEAQTSL